MEKKFKNHAKCDVLRQTQIPDLNQAVFRTQNFRSLSWTFLVFVYVEEATLCYMKLKNWIISTTEHQRQSLPDGSRELSPV